MVTNIVRLRKYGLTWAEGDLLNGTFVYIVKYKMLYLNGDNTIGAAHSSCCFFFLFFFSVNVP